MWMLFQAAIIFAVGSAAIYWQWTPNSLVVGIISIGAAFAATALLSGLLRLAARARDRRARRTEHQDQSPRLIAGEDP